MSAPAGQAGTPTHPAPPVPDAPFLAAEAERLLAFAAGARHPAGGFGYLGEGGSLVLEQGVHTWVTARMTHCFALAHLLGRPGSAELVDAGLTALLPGGLLHDDVHGGWFASLVPGADGRADPTAPAGDTGKGAYPTAFVVLAASSALIAGRGLAAPLLAEALDVLDRRFWDVGHGLVADVWDRTWTHLEPYRGVNANMHAVEALLTAADATGQAEWRHRAGRIVERVVHGSARSNGWQLVEHHDADWNPLPDYNTDDRAHPFRPYGVTVGHLLEWSRLCLHLRAALIASGSTVPDWLLEDASAMFDVAVAQGWAPDGHEGFVYTTDFDGVPVVTARMHWVVCEAVAAAAALFQATGASRYADLHARWWEHARRLFVDTAAGSWHHELDELGHPASGTWAGKPDVYHALQATLVPRLPLAPTFAAALREQAAGPR